MRSRRWLLALAAITGACGGGERPAPAGTPERVAPPPPAPAAATAPVVTLRGFVRLDPSLMFRSCDMQINAAIRDSTGTALMAAYQTLRPAEEGLYVIATGSRSPEQEVVLRSLEFAGLPGPGEGCDQASLDYVVGVVGLDSDWRVLARNASLEFLPDSGETLYFPPGNPTDSGGVVRYRAVGDGHELEVVVTQVSCLGKGVSTSRQAEVTLDGRVMKGCAWRAQP